MDIDPGIGKLSFGGLFKGIGKLIDIAERAWEKGLKMIKLRLWQAVIILFFMCAGFIKVVGCIYKQADGIAILRVKSEIITGIKNGTPFYIKGSDIKLIPKGKRNAEITIASRRVESPTKEEEE